MDVVIITIWVETVAFWKHYENVAFMRNAHLLGLVSTIQQNIYQKNHFYLCLNF